MISQLPDSSSHRIRNVPKLTPFSNPISQFCLFRRHTLSRPFH